MSWPEAFAVVAICALGFGALVLLFREAKHHEWEDDDNE